MAKKEQTVVGFEPALERLESIVQRMESGAMGLDEMVGAFEEGQRLIAFCTAKLNEVENRIEMLVKNPQGQLETRPLDAAEAEAPPVAI